MLRYSKTMKKWIIIAAVAVVFAGGLVAALLLQPNDTTNNSSLTTEDVAAEKDTETPNVDTPGEGADEPVAEPTQEGRYTEYSESAVSAEGYDTTALFFHAAWCPECRAFESAIVDGGVPDGVQILKVDYDSSTDLRQKYGVTLQSTFVSVNDNGDEVSTWVGYGEDKSVDAILENL